MHTIKKINKLRLTNFTRVIGLDIDNELFVIDGKVRLKQKDFNSDFITIDLQDCIISPGFIDVQVNGFKDCSFWKFPDFSSIDALRQDLAFHGVVAFCPTIITRTESQIIELINHINSHIKKSSDKPGAKILGIHIEGIFISKFGVHESKYSKQDLTIKNIEPFIKENVVMFTLAPELDKTGEAIKFLQRNNILVSIGHTNATYKEGLKAINEYNLKTATHMFNAMRGIDGFIHRGKGDLNLQVLRSKLEDNNKINPDKDGIMLALLKSNEVLCTVIADGVHVNRQVVSILREYKDKNHFSLVSDLVSSDFYNQSKLQNILGGSQDTLDNCVANLINWKVSNLEESLISASLPISNQLKIAQNLGLGKIILGKEANIIFWNTKRNVVKGTIIGDNIFLNY
ncbi:MAG: amidohydrolase family protein [Candidatus Melainabacteria bacterium]|nr:amidohydrolase family protein [Candidatus Melainabacteria bacterium]